MQKYSMGARNNAQAFNLLYVECCCCSYELTLQEFPVFRYSPLDNSSANAHGNHALSFALC